MLEFKNISKSFGSRIILENISFRLGNSRILAILGPSGIGKTTILRIAAGTVKPDSGEVYSDRQRIGFVFQEPRLLPWRTALANVTLVLKNNKALTAKQQAGKAAAILKRLGLQGFENYYPAQLSGGMRQRVAIARAFVLEPDLLLLDEPFAGLDLGLKSSLQQMLLELLAWHPADMLYVTHEPHDAVLLADQAIVLAGEPGRITAGMEFDLPREQRDQPYLHAQAAKLTAILTGT
jgi:NitT/TauT family transport system ATP-binding protein